jgi:hypothetical protein
VRRTSGCEIDETSVEVTEEDNAELEDTNGQISLLKTIGCSNRCEYCLKLKAQSTRTSNQAIK